MKKIISCLLALTIFLSILPTAFASAGEIVESIFHFRDLKLDAVVDASSDVSFSASVDGSNPVEISAKELDPGQVGHIIVVDLAFAWTIQITEENDIIPALNAYLNHVDSGNQIMFILVSSGSYQPTTFMAKDKASLFVSNSIKLPEKDTSNAYRTTIDSALKEAFTIATNPSEGPLFKQVFALVDPANPGLGNSATDVYKDYLKSGNSFPVLISPIYSESYMKNYGDRPSATRVNKGMEHYQAFAVNNGSVLATLNSTHKHGIDTTSLSAMITPRHYFSLDLAPLHPLIDYSKNEHEIEVFTTNSRGTQISKLYYGIPSNLLPPSLATPTPEVTPVVTPDPYVVRPGDNSNDAKIAIVQLFELYYIQADDKTKLPGSYDESCEYAFMEFCKKNGLPREGSISIEAFNLLMSEKAIPAPTATPTPAQVTPTPSPTPTAVPRIYIGANSTSALRAISRLKELYYLNEETRYSEWDGECMLAFQNLCEDNGIVYDEEYIDDTMFDWLISTALTAKATATPIITPTQTPAPTIPAQGYSLGDQDTENSTFIAQMQAVLQSLNLYTSETTIGTLDQPTLDAIAQYCQAFNMTMKTTDSVERTIVTDILNNGANRKVPATPEPSVSERFSSFLQKDALYLGNFIVKMWMLLLLVVVLIFILLLIVILTNRNKGHTDFPYRPLPHNSESNTPAPTPGGSVVTSPDQSSDSTLPINRGNFSGDDDDPTVKLGSGINVTLTIAGGPSAGTIRVLIGQNRFVIGRRTKNGTSDCDLILDGDASVSRKHVALTYVNKQLMLFNLSSNGTLVNGQQIEAATSSADSEATLPLSRNNNPAAAGFSLKRGDTIEISGYRITVNW